MGAAKITNGTRASGHDVATAIPLTTTTNQYTDPGAAVFDFGGTPFQAGYLYVQNASAFVSLKVGNSLGNADWQTELPYSPTLIPLLAGEATPWRRTTGPDLIYGVRARSLATGTPAVVYGGAFQPGEATSLPSNQLTGTVTPSGGVVPGVSLINGVTGIVTATGAITAGTGFSVVHSGTGVYDITFTPNLSVRPVIVGNAMGGTNGLAIPAGPPTAVGFEMTIIRSDTGATQDAAFDFIAIIPQ